MSGRPRELTVVDCHALVGSGKTWSEPEQIVDYELSLLFTRGVEAGIHRHCVMPARNDSYGAANSYVARVCGTHRDKLFGIAAHSPQREAGRLRQMLLEEVQSMGLRAVRSDGHPTRELLDVAQELDIPVMYYPVLARGQSLAGMYHMPATYYPEVKFILPHLGQFRSLNWSAHMEALDLARRYPNVYVDTSGVGSFKYLQMAVHELPPDKILFGTGAPELDPRVERESLRLLRLRDKDLAKVAGQNILHLLRAG